jgi:hypothetical protein
MGHEGVVGRGAGEDVAYGALIVVRGDFGRLVDGFFEGVPSSRAGVVFKGQGTKRWTQSSALLDSLSARETIAVHVQVLQVGETEDALQRRKAVVTSGQLLGYLKDSCWRDRRP